MGVESVDKGELVALCKFWESPPSVVCLSNAQSSTVGAYQAGSEKKEIKERDKETGSSI